jgi:hypothetical protein
MANECCTSAHNIEIVRKQLQEADLELARLRAEVKELREFKRIVYLLARGQVNG